MKEADKTAGALEAGKAGKSKEAAGSGRPLQHSRAHETLRPPDLCRKREAEVVIMWSVTMCRSEKIPNSDLWGFCMLESHYGVISSMQIGIF